MFFIITYLFNATKNNKLMTCLYFKIPFPYNLIFKKYIISLNYPVW